MPIPDFVRDLRDRIGHAALWLPGVTAVVLRGDEVLLARRNDDGQWAPIGGIVEPGEEIHVCARREVREETGVEIEVERLVGVRALPLKTLPNGDLVQYLDHTLRCRWLRGEPRVADDENSEVGWFPVENLPPMTGLYRARVRLAVENPRDARLGP